MKKSTLALAIATGILAQHVSAAGFIEDSKASISSRTLYFESDQRDPGGIDQRQTVTGLKFDFLSGFTQGTVGFGLDLQGVEGFTLGGGTSPHGPTTTNTVSPLDTDGTPVNAWGRVGANAKVKYSKTQLNAGNALAPNLPILIANDGRLVPTAFQGAILTSNEIENVTLTAGELNRVIGRASSNWTGIAAGGRKASDSFRFVGADWKATKDLTLQYYHSQLEDYYRQDFFGLIHVFPIASNQTFKTDLRYFNSKSDGKNGSDVNFQYKNGYNAGGLGKVDNNTWSAAFIYTLGGNSFTLGHQRVSDSGGMAYVNNANVVDGRGRNEGEGGASIYLYTDLTINSFARAGENTTFGMYSYDFAGLGVPGLKPSIYYASGRDVRGTGNATTGRYDEWERGVRLDYTLQSGPFKNLNFSLRRANFRTDLPETVVKDQDQTRFYINYTYALW